MDDGRAGQRAMRDLRAELVLRAREARQRAAGEAARDREDRDEDAYTRTLRGRLVAVAILVALAIGAGIALAAAVMQCAVPSLVVER